MLADVVGGDVGVELADGREANIAHGGVGKLGGEDGEAGGVGWVIKAGNVLGEDFAAETGKVEGLVAAVGAGDDLAAHDVADAGDDAVAIAEGVEAVVLVEERGEEPGAEVSAVGFIDEAAPEIGPERGGTVVEGGVGIDAVGGDAGEAEEDEGGVVEGLFGGDFEVVVPAGRVDLGAGRDGTEVGHEAKDSLGLLAGKGDGVAVGVELDIWFGLVRLSGGLGWGLLGAVAGGIEGEVGVWQGGRDGGVGGGEEELGRGVGQGLLGVEGRGGEEQEG